MWSDFKRFIKHSFIYSLGNFLAKAVGFFLIPLYTRYLTPADYGILELLDLTASMVSIFLGLRISSAIIRFYYDFEGEEKREVISSALISIFFIAILIIVTSQFVSDKVSYLVFNTIVYKKYFKIVFICTALSLISTVPESYLIARQQSFFYTVILLGRLICYVTLNIYFIVVLKMGILGILYGSLITKTFNSFFLSIFCIIKNKLKFSFEKLKNMLKYGIPLIPATFGMFILNYSDRFFLQKLTSSTDVGIYALGYKFGYMLPFLVLQPIQMILNPQMFEISKRPDGKTTLEKMFTYIFLIIAFCAMSLSMLTEDAIKIMATPTFYSAYKIVPWVVLGYTFMGLSNFFQGGLMIKKYTHYIGLGVFLAALSNPALNFLLIPKFKAMGAAYSTAISFFIMLVVNYWFCQRVFPIKCEWNRIFKISLVSLFLLLLSQYSPTSSLLLSLFTKTLLILSFPLLLYIVRFFTEGEIEKVISIMKTTFTFCNFK